MAKFLKENFTFYPKKIGYPTCGNTRTPLFTPYIPFEVSFFKAPVSLHFLPSPARSLFQVPIPLHPTFTSPPPS